MRHTWLATLTLAAAAIAGCGEQMAADKPSAEAAAVKAADGDKAKSPDAAIAPPGTKGDMNNDPKYPKGDPQPAPPKADEPKADPAKPADAPKSAALSADEAAEVAKLPDAADQKLAAAQLMCPVSDEHLGSMGMPIKKVVGDKTAFLCCKSCVESFDKEPAKFLAKVGAAKK